MHLFEVSRYGGQIQTVAPSDAEHLAAIAAENARSCAKGRMSDKNVEALTEQWTPLLDALQVGERLELVAYASAYKVGINAGVSDKHVIRVHRVS
ncbi:MAG: hypothetical protein Q8P71_02455 [bacterium]|nr:hypothetical protein [bacterium]